MTLLARLRAKRSNVIEHEVPVLSFVDMEAALLKTYRIRRQGSTLFLSDSKAGSFRPEFQTAPLFIKDYLAKGNLSQHWREALPRDFLAWLLITAPAYGVNKTIKEKE